MKRDGLTIERIKLLHPQVRDEATEMYNEICSRLTGKAMCRFTYTLRTFAEQDKLYALGRTVPNTKKVTNAKGGQSYHNYGLACFSDDTEILTDNGWKMFGDLNNEDSVMCFKDGNLFYDKPKAIISNDYYGEMVSIQTRSVDLLITPNHKMVVQKKTGGFWDAEWGKIDASEIDYRFRIPTAGEFRFSEIVPAYPFDNQMAPEDWWEFMGWYISEGSCIGVSDGVIRTHGQRFKVYISQKEGSKEWHLIKDCLDRTGFTYNYYGHEFIIHLKELHSCLFPLGNSYQKRIPKYLLSAPKYLLEILYESLLLGDGTHYGARETYWTVNKELADDVAHLCVLLGKSFSIYHRLAREQMLPHGEMLKTFNIQYAVNSRRRKTQELRNGDDNFHCIGRQEYNGIVYCVSTDAGAIVVKRNGKVAICGNCDICLLIDKDGDGKHEEASWDNATDFDGDKIADFMEVVIVAKMYGWEWGGDWTGGFIDKPHFQKTFGLTVMELKNRWDNKMLMPDNNYVKLS